MLIGIDGNEANVENRVGVGEYALELLRQFRNFTPPAGGSNFQFRIYLKDKPIEDLPKEKEGWDYRVVGPKKLWTQIGLPLDLYFRKPKPSVFFTPTHYAPRFSPIPTIISIMDLSYIHFPSMFKKRDLFKLNNWTRRSASNARKIITISCASKNDIIKYYDMPPEKVVVTYPGVKEFGRSAGENNSVKKLRVFYGIEKDYVLFVGTLQPRKNIIRLIEAFAQLLQSEDYKDLVLVIVGKKGWHYEDILQAPQKYNIQENVLFIDFVPDEDLWLFYKNAKCFVLPSLYEGFGLPILEAMKNDCPVITSNVSSMPEVGGDAALYVNPESVEDIAKKIMTVLKDSNLREQMIKKGKIQVKKFSWEKTAKETLDVIKEVAVSSK